VHELRVKIH